MGSAQRFGYPAIGDAVNVAARLEGLTKQLKIAVLMTENTAQRVSGPRVLEVELVCVVGRREHFAIYTVLPDNEMTDVEFAGFAATNGAMLAAYKAGDFAGAEESVMELRSNCPIVVRYLYDVYAERISLLRGDPPEDWDGIFRASEK